MLVSIRDKKEAGPSVETTKIKAIFICSYPDVCCCSSALGQEDHLTLFVEREKHQQNPSEGYTFKDKKKD